MQPIEGPHGLKVTSNNHPFLKNIQKNVLLLFTQSKFIIEVLILKKVEMINDAKNVDVDIGRQFL
jgi:hypothetical protein